MGGFLNKSDCYSPPHFPSSSNIGQLLANDGVHLWLMEARMGWYPETKSQSPLLEGVTEIDRHPLITLLPLLLSNTIIHFGCAYWYPA